MDRSSLKVLYKKSILYKTFNKTISNYYIKKLKNKDFTILCPNCIGGCIYHRLELPFLSPTINLQLDQSDFVEFCINLDQYEKEQLHFISTDKTFPVATLGDDINLKKITIEFIHYSSEIAAEEKWNLRFKRINRKNLYIILYNCDAIKDYLNSLRRLDIQNLVVLSAWEQHDIPELHVIKPSKKHGYNYLFYDIFGIRYYEKKWDFISFLNTKSGII